MLNISVIQGRLTKDPELRRTGSGIAVASFTVAVDRDRKDENGELETDFIDVCAWRGTAEFVCKYFHKGSMAVVSGRLQIRNWQDKDGNKRRSAEIVAGSVYFGESRKSQEGNYTAPSQNSYPGGGGDFSESLKYAQQLMNGNGASDFAMIEDDDAQLPF